MTVETFIALAVVFVTPPEPTRSTVSLVALCDDRRIDELRDALRPGLADRGYDARNAPLEAVVPVRPCDGRVGRELKVRLAKADEAFYALKLAEARTALTALRAEIELLGMPSELGAAYVQATVLLARIALQNKERGEAERLAAGLLHIRPSFDTKAQDLHPQVAALLDAAAVKAKNVPRAALEVTTKDARIPVEVDGVEQCVTPCSIEGLTAGAHIVSLRPRLGPTIAGKVELSRGSELALDAPQDWRGMLFASLESGDTETVVGLSAKLAPGRRHVVLSSIGADGGLSLWLVDTTHRRFSALRFQQLDARFAPDRVAAGLKALEQDTPTPAAPIPVAVGKDETRFGLRLLLAGALALTAPQRDLFSPGGAAIGSVWLSPAAFPRWLSLSVAGGYVVLGGDVVPDPAGVGLLGGGLRVAGGLGSSRWALAAHGGGAMTDDLWRVWTGADLAVTFPVGPLELGPAVSYVRVFDRGQASADGDANLLLAGVVVGFQR